MADNVMFQSCTLATPAACTVIATDDVGCRHYQIVKIAFGADNTATQICACNPLPVTGAVTNAGLTELAAAITCNQMQVDIAAISGVTFPVTDNCGSLTVDGTVSICGTVPVSDACGSLTVDGTVSVSNAHSADYDTGAGTDTTTAFGIAVPACGGAAVVPGSAADGLLVNLGSNNDVTICGTVTVALGGTPASNLATLAGGVSGAQYQVDIAAISGVTFPVTDNCGVLTVGGSISQFVQLNIGCIDPLAVAIVDGCGSQIVCFGGSAAVQTYDAAADFITCGADSAYAIAAVRDDVLTCLTPADGDYVPFFVNAQGALWVKHSGDICIADGCNSITVDNAALTELAAAINCNILDVCIQNASLTVDLGANNDVSLNAGTNIVGAAVLSGHASAGTALTTLRDADVDNTAQSMKASAGRLYFLEAQNPNSTDAYLHFYDAATCAVTVGTTTPKLSFLVPGGDGTRDGAYDHDFTIPVGFATAITYAATTTVGGGTDPTTGLILNGGYV